MPHRWRWLVLAAIGVVGAPPSPVAGEPPAEVASGDSIAGAEPIAGADSSAALRPRPRAYAREDTMRIAATFPVEVTAKRVSLEEILQRCIDAEKRKYEGVDDIQFTMVEKVILHYGSPDDPNAKQTVHEVVQRVYRRQPDLVRSVHLGEREYTVKDGRVEPRDEEEEAPVRVDVGTDRSALTDLPFFFEDLSDYRFAIAERIILEDRVLYRITFNPCSDFKPRPKGEFWIDTTDFEIFHMDLTFMENVPVPVVLKGVDHLAIEKKRIGDLWVYARIRLRKIPFVKIPQAAEIVVVFSDYAVNQGLTREDFEVGE
jgi:hypothetical protein